MWRVFIFLFLKTPKNVYFISVAPRHEYFGVEKRIWRGMSISNHWLRKWIKGFCWLYQYRDNISLMHDLSSYKIRLPKLSLICPTMIHLPTRSKQSDGLPYLKSALYIDTLPLLSTSTNLWVTILKFWETQTSIVKALEEGTISVFLSLKRITESRDFSISTLWNGTF